MSFIKINDWLNSNGPFVIGVELLKAYGKPSSTDLFLYAQQENSVLYRRLHNQLETLIRPDVNQARINSNALRGRPITLPPDGPERVAQKNSLAGAPREDITVSMLPAELRPLRIELKRKHAMITYLRGSLARIPDGMDLKRTALQIIQLHAEAREGWMRLEAWRTTGVIPEEPRAKVLHGDAELLKRRNNLRTYISRHESGKRSLPEAKLAAYKAELNDINNKLDAEDNH
jgi:hypothetical protein